MVATKPVERSVLGASCNDRESENDCRPQGYIDDSDGVKGVDEGRWLLKQATNIRELKPKERKQNSRPPTSNDNQLPTLLLRHANSPKPLLLHRFSGIARL
jgi:hypothetical protein